MYSVSLPDGTKLFVKIVPIKMWNYQWTQEDQWEGEFTTDGENFVMEAAALAFLHEYAPGIAPKLVAILELSGAISPGSSKRSAASTRPGNIRRSDDTVTHIAIVSELYGEDLLDYLDRRDRRNKPLSEDEKHALQIGCVKLLRRLHDVGLAHLDFTPENILVGHGGLRLCDFAKSTPLMSSKLRHVPVEIMGGSGAGVLESTILYEFESCEPTVGKGAYMPPECWSIYWRLETQRILRPLEDLKSLRSSAERVSYYFKASCADVYMAGVVLFWIWSDGGIWKCSDAKQDDKYYHLLKGDMNFDLFRECRAWPAALKSCLQKTLTHEPWRRHTLPELLACSWIADFADPHAYLEVYSPRNPQREDPPQRNSRRPF
ncbi:putative serine/threonine protein kinase [Gregarina niphandrodes]|uniref:non-specific serine/threonine protein kinase n=1 Tax=Gregarina niphandrodes TaxID=110365 RepID=A0A023AXT3_GRENI|nr:putative serine/threonine protein kinase [Gregarina niphandrodes]EZG43278.1 putative serine/threonine protein kinase [Gregarina niphandrodes]|eukprot:XP_011133462.1 putative serine/threonine protein kinase [Gregarina niphandrodes]